MKKLYFFAIFAFFIFLLTSCSHKDKNGPCESNADCPLGYICNLFTHTCEPAPENDPDNGTNSGSYSGNNSQNENNEEEQLFTNCTPGEQQTCEYKGPAETLNVGPCKAGVRTCKEDGTWGICEGGYEPVAERGELCGDGIDNDCNGIADDGTDFDGDGYGACSDCCEDSTECQGYDPTTVYPGAYEMIDTIDNNCDGNIDEPTSCDGDDKPLEIGDYEGNAVKLAHAMGICGDQLVSAEISLAGEPVVEFIADDSCEDWETYDYGDRVYRVSLPMPYYEDDYQTFAAEPKFGWNIVPLEGSKIAILSTGHWKEPTKWEFCATLDSGDMKTASKIPEDWINMMPNCEIPRSLFCGGTTVTEEFTNQCEGKEIPSVQDPIMLTLKVKVPQNARAFQFNLFFFSNEYPHTVCNRKNYNDFFIALLDSEYNKTYPDNEFQNPHDKNLAKDEQGNYVGLDLAPDGLFKVCGSNGDYASNCIGTTLLQGTGFDTYDAGGTGWLTTRGNVVPGETITLRFALWEQGTVPYGPDHSWDSTVLLDGFKWLVEPAKAVTGPQ